MGVFKRNCCNSNDNGNGICKQVKARVAFLDEIDSQLAATQSTIELAFEKKLFPNVEAISFDYYPIFTGDNLDEVVDAMEEIVNRRTEEGFNFFVPASRSSFAQFWIRGDAGNLGGLNINQRHPDVIFVLLNLGTTAASDIPAVNVWKLIDTFDYTDLFQRNLLNPNLLGEGGQVLAVYQFPDEASEDIVADYIAAGESLDPPIPIDFLSGQLAFTVTPAGEITIDPDSIQAALQAINALPPNSLVLIAVNGDPAFQNAFTLQFPWEAVTAENVHFLGINYAPIDATAPVDISQGFSTNFGSGTGSLFLAPIYYKELGFNPLPVPEPRNPLMIEAMALASTTVVCKPFFGTDGLSRFDAFRVAINPYFLDTVIPANTLEVRSVPGSGFENPRWTAANPILGPRLGACCDEVVNNRSLH